MAALVLRIKFPSQVQKRMEGEKREVLCDGGSSASPAAVIAPSRASFASFATSKVAIDVEHILTYCIFFSSAVSADLQDAESRRNFHNPRSGQVHR